MSTPTSFTISPTQVFDLLNPGIKRTGTWTYNGREFRTLAAAKAAVRAALPQGTTVSWQRNQYGDWKGTVS